MRYRLASGCGLPLVNRMTKEGGKEEFSPRPRNFATLMRKFARYDFLDMGQTGANRLKNGYACQGGTHRCRVSERTDD